MKLVRFDNESPGGPGRVKSSHRSAGPERPVRRTKQTSLAS